MFNSNLQVRELEDKFSEDERDDNVDEGSSEPDESDQMSDTDEPDQESDESGSVVIAPISKEEIQRQQQQELMVLSQNPYF